MKIRNEKSKSTLEAIFSFGAFFVVFTVIDIIIIYLQMNNGMSFLDVINWIKSEFIAADKEMKFVEIILIVFPFFWGWLLIYEILNRKRETKLAELDPAFIKCVDFQKDSLKIIFKNQNLNTQISYYDIETVSFSFETGIGHNKYGSYPCVFGVNIKITSNEKEYSVRNCPVNINKIYKIISLTYMSKQKYDFTGNGLEIKDKILKNIQNISKNKYNIPFLMNFKKWLITILICIPVIPLLFLGYMLIPYPINDTDKNYAAIIQLGYEYYQNNQYENSINEYDKALTIHNDDSTLYYYKSLSCYENKQYRKAIENAQKGIENLNHKSAYQKTQNWKFIGNDSIGLYTTLGDSYYKIKDYENAKLAYDYVVEHVKYKYSDVYKKRGKCYFYMNKKDLALQDFYKQQEIITEYFQDQENTEYKDVYPRFDENDVKKINKWIFACKR